MIEVGSKVQLIKDIYDDGEDHHPPGYIGYAGEIVEIKQVHKDRLVVRHTGNPGGFIIYENEWQCIIPNEGISYET